MPQRSDRDQWREIMKGFSLISQVGLIMVGCILAGFLLGLWLGGTLGAVLGLIAGVAAGFLNCYRALMTQAGPIGPSSEKGLRPSERKRDGEDR
jgi:F0F1-type ATP synthase assembly protein I